MAGRPEEYFWRDNEPLTAQADYEAFVADCVRAGATRNGVFGARVMWGYVADFLTKLRGSMHDGIERSDREVLEAILPGLHFIWIRRNDTVAQAVSFAKAIQTQQWYYEAQPQGEPRFDFDQIDFLAQEVPQHNSAWARWFEIHAIKPYEVLYEELVDHKVEIVSGISAFLGIELPRHVAVEEKTRRQGDALNAAWIQRYRQMKATRTALD